MPTYITLCKLTDQGVKDIKNAPKRIRSAQKMAEKVGGKITGFYLTIGDYDYIAISEAPNDEVACTFLLDLGTTGLLRTTTLKAFTLEEFTDIVKKLP
ncbi:MAG: GYD domain-containing protein [Deltaproteobacteria bacterium]|nr:GYD domain-containing protein [Deltaproteobacteria bacterium]